jgi:hypothetical protein
VAHTLDELIQMQRAADQAHTQVLALRDQYGRPTQVEWTDEQTLTYEQAWRDWRQLAVGVQAAVTEYAEAEKKSRFEIEAAVRRAAWHPEPESAED